MMNLVVSFSSFANTPKTMYVNADDEIRMHKLKLIIKIIIRRRTTTTKSFTCLLSILISGYAAAPYTK